MRKKELLLFSAYCNKYGGTETVVRVAKETLKKIGIEYRHVMFSNFSQTIKASDKNILNYRALPIPIYLNYLIAAIKCKNKLKKGYKAIAVGGTPVGGTIPMSIGMEYILWFGSTLFDEYKIRKSWEELLEKNYSIFINKIFLFVNKKIEKMVLEKTRSIISLSPYLIESLNKDYDISQRKCIYLPWPIEAKSEALNYEINMKEPKLLSVGRVDDKRKNYQLLLKAFRLFLYKFPKAKLKIVGKVSSSSKIVRLCEKTGISNSVIFLGELSNEELLKEYKTSDVFVLASKQEGLGIVFLEAMSFGLPVVSTNCGGPKGIIKDDFNGYLVNIDDEYAFSSAIEKIYYNKENYLKLRNNAYNYIKINHDPNIFENKFKKIIEEKLFY